MPSLYICTARDLAHYDPNLKKTTTGSFNKQFFSFSYCTLNALPKHSALGNDLPEFGQLSELIAYN